MSNLDVSVWADGTLSWHDFFEQISLPPLPGSFPLPPDETLRVHISGDLETEVSDKLSAESKFGLKFSLDYPIGDNLELWQFRLGDRCRFEFWAYAESLESSGKLTGEIFLYTRVKLPDVPELHTLQIDTGDSEGWIDICFHASLDKEDKLKVFAKIDNAVLIDIQIPGMLQPEPPIHMQLDSVALNLEGSGTDISASFSLSGSFYLRPILAPSELPIAYHINSLLAGMPVLRGVCHLAVGLEGETEKRPYMALAGTLEGAGFDIDLFSTIQNLARGLSGSTSDAPEVPLDVDFGFRIIGIAAKVGGVSSSPTGGADKFSVNLKLQVTFGSVDAVGSFSLTDSALSIGLDRMVIPLNIPRFPITRAEFEQLYNEPNWKETLDAKIKPLEQNFSRSAQRTRARLEVQKALMGSIFSLRGDNADTSGYRMNDESKAIYGEWLATLIGAMDSASSVTASLPDRATYKISDLMLERFWDSVLVPKDVRNTIEASLQSLKGETYSGDNKFLAALKTKFSKQDLEHYKEPIFKYALIRGATLQAQYDGQTYIVAEDVSLVLQNIKLTIPFKSPRDISISGGARMSGFLKPVEVLNTISLTIGLSLDLIYFSLESADDGIPIPDLGRYKGGRINFSQFRFGFGYTKRSLTVAFAGSVVLPKQLVEDLDTSDITVAGVRLPVQTRLYFRLDLIPVPYIKVVPIFQFNLDLRQDRSPGLTDSRTCTPYWDGLQLIVPDVIHLAFKHLSYSPFFATVLAPNYAFDGDLVLGNDKNGLSIIINDSLTIEPVRIFGYSALPIPGFADGNPFCEDLCISLRVAGFAINFNLQRPLPSASPLAIFELLALLSDPANYKIDPRGELANTLRLTLEDAYIVLPSEVRRLFPHSEGIVKQTIKKTINLADFMAIAQQLMSLVTPIVKGLVAIVQEGGNDSQLIEQELQRLKNELDRFSYRDVLGLFPAELRKVRLNASFAGFEAYAMLVLMSKEEVLRELARQQQSAPSRSIRTRPMPSTLALLKSGKSMDLDEFRSLCFKLPALPGAPPTYDRNNPSNNIFASAELQVFDRIFLDSTLNALPASDAMLLAATVRIMGSQQGNFLGYLSSDGSFRLASQSSIAPLVLAVAGLQVPLNLTLKGSIQLTGNADGTGSLQVQGFSNWDAIPGILKVAIGSSDKPVTLSLKSDGRFHLQGAAIVTLFNRSDLSLEGFINVTETHCFFTGSLCHQERELYYLSLDVQGRIGPHDHFEFMGLGTLNILSDFYLENVQGKINEQCIEIEARLNWKHYFFNIPVFDRGLTALRGKISIKDSNRPELELQALGKIYLFDATMDGSLTIKDYQVSMSGMLQWQGEEWLNAKLTFSRQGLNILGHTSFNFDLPSPQQPGLLPFSLYARVDLYGQFRLDTKGKISALSMRGNVLVGLRSSSSEQVFPIATSSIPLTHFDTPLTDKLRLVSVKGFGPIHWNPDDLIPNLEFTYPSNPLTISMPKFRLDAGSLKTPPRIDAPNSVAIYLNYKPVTTISNVVTVTPDRRGDFTFWTPGEVSWEAGSKEWKDGSWTWNAGNPGKFKPPNLSITFPSLSLTLPNLTYKNTSYTVHTIYQASVDWSQVKIQGQGAPINIPRVDSLRLIDSNGNDLLANWKAPAIVPDSEDVKSISIPSGVVLTWGKKKLATLPILQVPSFDLYLIWNETKKRFDVEIDWDS